MNVPIIARSVKGEVAKFIAKDVSDVEHALTFAKSELGDSARVILALWVNPENPVQNQGVA